MSDDALQPKAISDSWVTDQVYKVFPNDMNSHRTVFGGLILATIDRLCATVAERHAERTCVTASVDAVHFMAPALEGETLVYSCGINRTWKTSMEIGAKCAAENSITGEHRHILSAYFTFVALDDDGKPTRIPPIRLENDQQRQRYEEAQLRRDYRLKHAEAIKAYREGLKR